MACYPYLECREVDDAVNIWMRIKDLVKLRLIRDIAGVVLGSLSCDELDSVDGFLRRVIQIVDNDNLVVGLQQRQSCERANVPGSTDQELSMKTAFVAPMRLTR